MYENLIFTCPVCGNNLQYLVKQYACPEKHSYDIAREGYVNLLLPNIKKSSEPGDSTEMIRSRNRFLEREYYRPLAEFLANEVSGAVTATAKSAFTVLDAGCGEGYYSSYIENLLHGRGIRFYGIDISKEAVRLAAKRNRNITYAVAGLFRLPVAENSVDCILNIFAPSPADEFKRILSPSGIIIHVYPGERHLYSLRGKLFDHVTPLEKEDNLLERFRLRHKTSVEYELLVKNRQDLADLVNMTPYAWKTRKEKIGELLENSDTLKTTAHFAISVYNK